MGPRGAAPARPLGCLGMAIPLVKPWWQRHELWSEQGQDEEPGTYFDIETETDRHREREN